MERYDFIVLGGGGAGLTAAHSVRSAGKKVAVIDPTPIGGLCALKGCNPKKVLVRATEVLHLVKSAGEHGVRTGEVTMNWNAVIERKHTFTDPVTEGTEQSLSEAGIEYLKTPARFISENELEAGGRKFSFEGALISTGSAPRRLTFPGADHVFTSDQILEQREPPRRLAIIGGGVVAFEFGQVFARLGSAVHMLVRGEQVLMGEDKDMVSRLVEHMQTLGLVLHEKVEVKAIEKSPTAYDVHLSDGTTVTADFVLNAAGRPPQLEGLGLEAAGVQYSEKGVKVNEYLRSPDNHRIFAAGDAHGKKQLSPVAGYEGDLVAHNFLNGDEKRAEYAAIPRAVFTVPPLASVGMTEEQARSEGSDVEVAKEDMSAWTVFRIDGEKPAYGKVISEKNSGRILGAHLFGPGADEHIHVFAMAMRYGIPRERLGEMIYVYPALGSALSYLIPGSGGMA